MEFSEDMRRCNAAILAYNYQLAESNAFKTTYALTSFTHINPSSCLYVFLNIHICSNNTMSIAIPYSTSK